jgi:hypothetical protein
MLKSINKSRHWTTPTLIFDLVNEKNQESENRFNFGAKEHESTPFSPSELGENAKPFHDKSLYKRQVMMLQHITKTRIEIKHGSQGAQRNKTTQL